MQRLSGSMRSRTTTPRPSCLGSWENKVQQVGNAREQWVVHPAHRRCVEIVSGSSDLEAEE